jgi:DNA helicase IV
MTKDVERRAEQLYFDGALGHRERRRDHFKDLPTAAAHKGAAQGLLLIAQETARQLRGPEEAVAFGRIDFEDRGEGVETFYVGHNAIWDEDTSDILVVNWRCEIAAPYYTATHKDSLGLSRKRSYSCEKNTILDFDDIVFAELAARVAALRITEPEPDDNLLNELSRSRTGEMQEIVRTIQAAQFEIVRAPFEQLLVVQGGPGTGKTVVALHRVSWLLYNKADFGAQDVLVVGPNPTFVRYIRSVLPSLGDRDVRHTDIVNLGAAQVRVGREEEPAVAQLKGDRRMANLLDRGLQQRIRVPADDVTIGLGRTALRLSSEDLRTTVDRFRSRPYAAGRVSLREELRAMARGATSDMVETVLDRVWPNLTAPQFVQELLGSQNRLLEAGGEEFSAREIQTLYRQAAQKVTDETWTAADVALLDHVYARISEQSSDRYGHVVVDEAQDLSPMQLAMVARRSNNGSMTILGDIAQSTGPWARNDWSSVIEALARSGVPATIEVLEVGYRVPRPAFELAIRALGDEAPGVLVPRVVREGPDPQVIETTERHRADTTVAAARSFASNGCLVGVICTDAMRASVLAAFRSANVRVSEARREGLGGPITIISPIEAKGLEFDAVVVVEPVAIAAEDAYGRRQLYIALTRTTDQLAVIYTEPFLAGEEKRGEEAPESAEVRSGESTPSADATISIPEETPVLGSAEAVTRAVARHFVEEMRSVVQENQIDSILRAIRDELDKD